MNSKDSLKVSVVTINYNGAHWLDATLQSVLSQTYPDIEYIIIDGGSTDGSVNIIKGYEGRISYWVSEPDKGIYHAMNKGILQAKGDYLSFMNSGDVFHSTTAIEELVNNLDGNDFIFGNIILKEKDRNRLLQYPAVLDFRFFLERAIPHQSSLIRRGLFDTFGLYNENWKISSDWEFFLLCICKHNCSYKYIDFTVCVYDHYGVSSRPEGRILMQAEKDQIVATHFPCFMENYRLLKELEAQNKEMESLTRTARRLLKLTKKRAKGLFSQGG